MINAMPGVKNFSVTFPPSRELDVVGYLIHAVHQNDLVNGDFSPSITNLINNGPETSFYAAVEKPGTWYIKVAAYDTFEDLDAINFGGLNYSAMVSVNVLDDALILPPELYDEMRTDFIVKDVRFFFGDSPAQLATAAVLHWDGEGIGAIIRGDVSYGLAADTGTIPSANGMYVIATLNKTTLKASFSVVPMTGGVPSLVDTDTETQVVIAVTSTNPPAGGINNICYVRQSNSMELEGALIRNLTVTGNQVIGGTLVIGSTSTINGVTAGTLTTNVNTALSTSNTANSTAGTALNAANSALGLAGAAQSSADTATGLANEAINTSAVAVGTANGVSSVVNAWKKPGFTLIDGNQIYSGDMYVDTLQIKGEAITIPAGSYIAGPQEWNDYTPKSDWTNNYYEIVRLVINTHIRNELSLDPKPLLIFLTYTYTIRTDQNIPGSYPVDFFLRRNNLDTGEINDTPLHTVMYFFSETMHVKNMIQTPPAGTYAYSFVVKTPAYLEATFTNVCMTLITVKR